MTDTAAEIGPTTYRCDPCGTTFRVLGGFGPVTNCPYCTEPVNSDG